MALLRFNDIAKMDSKERRAKLVDLRFELIKSNVTVNKTNAKTKEIKRAISRIITFNSQERKSAPKTKVSGGLRE